MYIDICKYSIYIYIYIYIYVYIYMQGDFNSQKYLSNRSPCSSNSRPLLLQRSAAAVIAA